MCTVCNGRCGKWLLIAITLSLAPAAVAQSDFAYSLDGLRKSGRVELWVAVARAQSDDKLVSALRRKLEERTQGNDPRAVLESTEELAVALLTGDSVPEANQEEARSLARRSVALATSTPRAQLFLSLILARTGKTDEAISSIPTDSELAPGVERRLAGHLRAMFASWRGSSVSASERSRLMQAIGQVDYPMVLLPATDEWELFALAHFGAVTAKYKNVWSPLDLDILEFSVGSSYRDSYNKAQKEGNRQDQWQSLARLFEFYDAHDRPADVLDDLALAIPNTVNNPERRADVLRMLARTSLRSGDLREARQHLQEARKELQQAYPRPASRMQEELKLAAALDSPENSSLAVEAYEGVDATARMAPVSAEQIALRLRVADSLLRLHAEAGDLRRVADVYSWAKPLALRLDTEPTLSRGKRFNLDRLNLAQIRALSQISFRRSDAFDQIRELVDRMNDKYAPVSSRPAENVREAIEEAGDAGRAKTIDDHLNRVSAAEVQELAFPLLAQLNMYRGDWPAAKKALTQALYMDFERKGVCSVEQLRYWKNLSLAADASGEESDNKNWLSEWTSCSGAMDRGSREFADSLIMQSHLLRKQGDYYGAEYVLARSLKVLAPHTFAGDLSVAKARLELAELMLDQRRFHDAAAQATEVSAGLTAGSADSPEWQVLEARFVDLVFSNASDLDGTLKGSVFLLVQMASVSRAAAALQSFAARASLRDPKLAELVRRRLELQRRREIVDVRFQQVFGSNAKLNAKERDATEQNGAERKAVNKQLQEIDSEIQASGNQLDAFPSYVNFVRGRAISVSNFTGTLPSGWMLGSREALLVLSQGPHALFAMVLRRGDTGFFKLDLPRESATRLVVAIRATLAISAGQPNGPQLKPFDYASAVELYQRIWAPLASALHDVDSVVAVVDGPLQSLPLEILCKEVPVGNSGPGWLDEEVTFSYTPSVAAIRTLRIEVGSSLAKKPVVVMGPPLFERVSPPVGSSFRSFQPSFRPMGGSRDVEAACNGQLPPLPPETIGLSRDLARALGGGPSNVYLQNEITELKFRALNQRDPLLNYRVIAFVTHGLVAGKFDPRGEAEPALVLTPPPNCKASSPQNDGLLTASEISELSLDADWVLLLACNTAAADGTPDAEPLSGLASSFLFAGARALLVSHWSVDANATARFVQLAFEGTSLGARSERLRIARKKMRSESSEAGVSYSHPAFWAAFVLIGDAR